MNTLYAIDLFSGAGEITQALKNAGFEVRLAVELNPVFTKSYRLNHCRLEVTLEDYFRQVGVRHWSLLNIYLLPLNYLIAHIITPSRVINSMYNNHKTKDTTQNTRICMQYFFTAMAFPAQ